MKEVQMCYENAENKVTGFLYIEGLLRRFSKYESYWGFRKYQLVDFDIAKRIVQVQGDRFR